METTLSQVLMFGFAGSCLWLATGCADVSSDGNDGKTYDEESVGETAQPLWSKPSFEASLTVNLKHWHHFGPFPVVGAYGLFGVRLGPVSTDQDLYVRKGARPTLTSYDCRPYKGGTQVESCDLTANDSGDYYVSVHGYAAGKYYLNVMNNGNLGKREIDITESVAVGDWNYYGPFDIDAGKTSGAWLTPASADPDLYVTNVASNVAPYYFGVFPNENGGYSCRPWSGGTDSEYCATSDPNDQIVGVTGYSGSPTYRIQIHEL